MRLQVLTLLLVSPLALSFTIRGWRVGEVEEEGGERNSVMLDLFNILSQSLGLWSKELEKPTGAEFDHRKLLEGERVEVAVCPERQCRERDGRPLTCGTLSHQHQGRIVNGQPSDTGHHPWFGKVLRHGSMFCGSTLVTATFLVSAAHCFWTPSGQAQPGHFTVELGEGEDVQRRLIQTIFMRSDFERINYDNDIALIKLRSPVEFSSVVRPVCLPQVVEDLAGEQGMVAGWGKLQQGGVLPGELMELSMPVMGQAKCRHYTQHPPHTITDNMFCAGWVDGRADACQGDSGGPFTFARDGTTALVGVVSWGIGCAKTGYPGVYARLPIFLPWVADILQAHNSCVCEDRGKVRGAGKVPTTSLEVDALRDQLDSINTMGGGKVTKHLEEQGIGVDTLTPGQVTQLRRWLKKYTARNGTEP